MKKIIFIIVINLILYSNAQSELTIKIDRAKIGALPIMISVNGSSKNYLPNKFRAIIENDLYGSGYFNVLDSANVKNNIANKNTQYALWALAGTNYFLKANILLENQKEYIKFDLHNVIKKSMLFSYKISLKKNSVISFQETDKADEIMELAIENNAEDVIHEENYVEIHTDKVDYLNIAEVLIFQ